MISSLAIFLFPILFPALTIWSFFIKRDYIYNLSLELTNKGVQEGIIVQQDFQNNAYLIAETGFHNNIETYITTLFCQALLYMLLAFIVQFLIKKISVKAIKSTGAKIFFTILCLIIGVIGNNFIGTYAIDILCNGFIFELTFAEYQMLFIFAPFIFTPANDYFVGILLGIYTIYVIWAIINKGD